MSKRRLLMAAFLRLTVLMPTASAQPTPAPTPPGAPATAPTPAAGDVETVEGPSKRT